MARPRVFLSSTFYDLHQSREDLDRFVRSLGYDCVRHESGAIPYAKEGRLELSAYREVELCDIFVTIIGGKFGSESKEVTGYSITQNEIVRALEKGIQVYIFVERNTLTEYEMWKLNNKNDTVKYRFADDTRIYSFIDHLYALPNNNPIVGFGNVSEITMYLQDQWAGLFQRFLSQQSRLTEVSIVEDMRGVATTLREMVDFLSRSNQDKDNALMSILLANHPIFARLAKLTGTTYRIYFTNHVEMTAWLTARGWELADDEKYSEGSVEEWYHEKLGWIEFKEAFFNDNGHLKTYAASDWKDEWIVKVALAKVEPAMPTPAMPTPVVRRPIMTARSEVPTKDDVNLF
ncbi:DUF4062 domain-containing protein [Janthinobacterium lividum]|uniref:DUF4062 domain-containing protein n=1 Tax=Janthinobacterium lividum TaxID=29581 RepID=UPI0008753D3F|nr:DUF4062 domain-containing protein [Janthinobacterium lividum]MCC7714703.1 DUF4062 domain-containing protein [Janthinobacterium lividum]OEZ56045.1 hypothetical protein JANLI_29990 [Janthinobacterium lividum]WQE30097.1 DUF4062 domain-containing protein [Janthinobacterium lividum]STQ95598.1 Uncharacterised protein [Janthinobacterium lividum]